MKTKPTRNKKNQPATRSDLKIIKSNVAKVGDDVDKLAIATKNTFDRIEKKMATKDDLKAFATKDDLKALDKKVDRMTRGQKAMLGILEENNQLLKETRRLPERVARLERSVFRH